MYHHLPFAGGPDREKRVPEKRTSMYLPAGFSGVRVWKSIKGEGNYEKTYPSYQRRAGEEMEENPRSKSAKLRIFERA